MTDTLTFTDASFDLDVLQSLLPVLVDFWAEGCGGCRQIAPAIDAMASEYSGRAYVGKLDVLANGRTAKRYAIRSIPSLLLFKDGRVIEQSGGAISLSEVRKMLAPHV